VADLHEGALEGVAHVVDRVHARLGRPGLDGDPVELGVAQAVLVVCLGIDATGEDLGDDRQRVPALFAGHRVLEHLADAWVSSEEAATDRVQALGDLHVVHAAGLVRRRNLRHEVDAALGRVDRHHEEIERDVCADDDGVGVVKERRELSTHAA
jgi:hypothetical protein